MTNSPLTIYYEGLMTVGSVIYSYTPSSSSLIIKGYKALLRDLDTGSSATIDLKKNGTLLYQIQLTGLDTGLVEIPKVAFNSLDNLELSVSSVSGNLVGLTILLDVEVSYAVSTDLLTQQIQTPLIFRYEGVLEVSEPFFSYVAEKQVDGFGFGIQLRNAADADVLLGVEVNNLRVGTMLLPAGQDSIEGPLVFLAEVGDVISVSVLSTGSGVNPGESMIGYINYSCPDQTTFSNYQTPFILEYEGILNSTSNSVFRYTAPRDFTIFLAQAFSRNPVTQPLKFGLFRNGTKIAEILIPTGEMQSQIDLGSVINKSVSEGDLIELQYLSGDQSAGLIATIDYFISTDGLSSINFYSDPDSNIILIARQLGIGGAKADALSLENLQKYKQDVDNIINARLSVLYRTPLRKVSGASNPWPEPIQFVAQRLVLRYVLSDVYSEVEPNASSNISTQATIAEGMLTQILNREFSLRGQTRRSRDYGSNPYTEPMFVNNPNSTPPTSTP